MRLFAIMVCLVHETNMGKGCRMVWVKKKSTCLSMLNRIQEFIIEWYPLAEQGNFKLTYRPDNIHEWDTEKEVEIKSPEELSKISGIKERDFGATLYIRVKVHIKLHIEIYKLIYLAIEQENHTTTNS